MKFTGNRFSNFTDLETEDWKILFQDIKNFSDNYLDFLEKEGLLPGDYYWPKDPLMTNTRVWEYPYAIDILRKHTSTQGQLLDIGSALTFLPYYLSKIGFEVHAIDNDPQMVKWGNDVMLRMSELKQEKNEFKFKPLASYTNRDVTNIDFPDATFDVVTNVSVLEHLPLEAIIKSAASIHKKLKSGGLFVCTVDCLVKGEVKEGHQPLNDREFRGFLEILSKNFEFIEQNVHCAPVSLITNKRNLKTAGSVRQYSLRERLALAIRVFKKKNSKRRLDLEWTAYGFTLRKR